MGKGGGALSGLGGILPGTSKSNSDATIGRNILDPIGGQMMASQEAAADAAKAAHNAAMAQQQEARLAYRQTAGIVNPATAEGLASFDRDIARQEKNLSRQEQLISSIDPTIIEASQQALRLLRGESSSTLAPFQQQRQQQRQKLVNTLRSQLGPGAETSSAGMKALSQFDSESSQLMAGAQQQALGNLGNLSTQFTSQRPDMLRELNSLSMLGQGKTGLKYDQAKTLYQARMGLGQTAGAQYTGALLQAQSNQAAANSMLGMSVGAVGGIVGGYFGGPQGAAAGMKAGESAKGYGVAGGGGQGQ